MYIAMRVHLCIYCTNIINICVCVCACVVKPKFSLAQVVHIAAPCLPSASPFIIACICVCMRAKTLSFILGKLYFRNFIKNWNQRKCNKRLHNSSAACVTEVCGMENIIDCQCKMHDVGIYIYICWKYWNFIFWEILLITNITFTKKKINKKILKRFIVF